MSKRSDFEVHQFQAKSSTELLQMYKIKVEGAKDMKKSKESISKQEARKNSTIGSVFQEGRSTQMYQKKDQRKQPLITGSAIQEVRSTLMQHGK